MVGTAPVTSRVLKPPPRANSNSKAGYWKLHDMPHTYEAHTCDRQCCTLICSSLSCTSHWKLNKFIYGLKQAPRAWQKELTKTLVNAGLKVSDVDTCLFVRIVKNSTTYVAVYVDNLLIASNPTQAITETKNALASEYTNTDFGEPTSLHGLQIHRDRKKRMIYIGK